MGYSTSEAAKRLGIGGPALYSYLRRGVVKSPPRLPGGNSLVWQDADVEAAREILESRRTRPASPTSAD